MSEPDERNERPGILSGSLVAKSEPGGRFYLWVAALAIIQAFLLHASLFGGKGLVPADGIFNFSPWLSATNHPSASLLADQYLVFIPQHEFTHREFLRGEFPLWNPNLTCGEPNVASIQGALLFPINVLLLPVDPFYAAGIAAFLKLFLAGLFTMLYLRLLGASNGGAFFSGLVFSLCGFMICWLGHPHVNCAMWLPVLLYFVEKSFHFGRDNALPLTSRPALRIWAGLAITIGCFLLGGYPPTMVQGAIFISIYFLFRLAGEPKCQPRLRMALAAGAAVFGFCLATPALLPFLEYYRHSSMSASSTALDRTALRSSVHTLIFYLLPHLNGSPTEGFEDTMLRLGIGRPMANFVERTGYVGILPMLFLFCALFMRRCRCTFFFAGVTLFCLLAVYGVPPFPQIFHVLPILQQINPTRLILIASLSIAILAGLGWDSFWRLENAQKRIWLAAAFWAVIGIVVLCYWHRIEPRWKHLDAAQRSFLEPQFLMLAGSLAASATLLLPSMRRHPGIGAVLGLGWVAVDLLNFGMGLNPAIPYSSYYPDTPEIKWLEQDKTNFRIMGLGMTFAPNTAELYGLKDARGYDFVTVRNYEELINGNVGLFFFYRTASSLPDAFQLLGVKYVLNFNSPPPDPAMFDLVYSNQVTIYRNRQFPGRVMPVFNYEVDQNPASVLAKVRSAKFNPQQTILLQQEPSEDTAASPSLAPVGSSASIVAEQPDQINIEATMSKPGFLLLLDTYYPGWTATANGVSAPILRADYDFRAVQLPAGKSMVQFRYKPGSFRLGIILCLAALLGLGGILFYSFRPAAGKKAGFNIPA